MILAWACPFNQSILQQFLKKFENNIICRLATSLKISF